AARQARSLPADPDARKVGNTSGWKIGRQVEYDLDHMARRQRLVRVAPYRHRHIDVALRNLQFSFYGKLGRLLWSRRHGLGSPNHRSRVTLPFRVRRIFLLEYYALSNGRR